MVEQQEDDANECEGSTELDLRSRFPKNFAFLQKISTTRRKSDAEFRFWFLPGRHAFHFRSIHWSGLDNAR